jgi:hypothetical protein
MIGTGKVTHLRADFRHDHFGCGAGHARNGIQRANRCFKWVSIAWIRGSTRAMVSSRLST